MSDAPERSPALLAAPPKRGVGVRQLNKLPILFVIGGAMLVVAAIGYTYRDRLMQSVANAQQAASHKPEPGNGAAVLDGAPAGGEVEPRLRTARWSRRSPGTSSRPAQIATLLCRRTIRCGSGPAPGRGRRHEGEAGGVADYYAQLAQLQKDRLAAATSAMTAETGLGNSAAGKRSRPAPAVSGAAGGPAPSQVSRRMERRCPWRRAWGLSRRLRPAAYPPARVDASAQREKQAFLNQPGDVTGSSDDLQATLRDPSSPFLVMAGTAIPAVMIGGINSDMPGMVIGQVSQNVYDTATGRYLLIRKAPG